MEGLIPYLIRSMSKGQQRRNHDYRRLPETARLGRTTYQLSSGGVELVGNSPHRRTRSEFHPSKFDVLEQTSVDSSSRRKSFGADDFFKFSCFKSESASQ